MGKPSEKRQQAVITAQGMCDAAPSQGKGSYLKMPEGLKLFIPEKGHTYKLVFLPWKAGKLNPSGKPGSWVTNRYIPVHRGIGPSEETYICSARAFGKPCAVCEQFALLRSQGVDWEQLKDFKFKDRELFLVHDTEIPKSLYVWDESIHLFGDAFRGKIRKKVAWMAFADFEQGCIVEVEAREKKMGKGSCVDCTLGIEIEPRSEPLADWLVKAAEKYCIDDCVVETPYSKLKKLFTTLAGGEDETDTSEEEVGLNNGEVDEDEDEEPVVTPPRRGKKPAVKAPPVEEDEDEEDEDEEEEDEPEEDDEEDMEDEDDEPEPPKKAPRRRK